eukprot:1651594-Rhodomonas_salina.3
MERSGHANTFPFPPGQYSPAMHLLHDLLRCPEPPRETPPKPRHRSQPRGTDRSQCRTCRVWQSEPQTEEWALKREASTRSNERD